MRARGLTSIEAATASMAGAEIAARKIHRFGFQRDTCPGGFRTKSFFRYPYCPCRVSRRASTGLEKKKFALTT